jgi:hypothetical protein
MEKSIQHFISINIMLSFILLIRKLVIIVHGSVYMLNDRKLICRYSDNLFKNNNMNFLCISKNILINILFTYSKLKYKMGAKNTHPPIYVW